MSTERVQREKAMQHHHAARRGRWFAVLAAFATACGLGVTPVESASASAAPAVAPMRSGIAQDHLVHHASRPAGLVQVGNSKTNCIDATPGPTLIQAEHATGIAYTCLLTFSNADPAWSNWVTPWVIHPNAPYVAWLDAAPTTRTIILTQNLIPDSEDTNPNWRGQCAAGEFDKYARTFATLMVATGFGYSVIRLGAEMNGTWENDSIGNTPTQWHQWAQCFAQMVTTMRAVPGSHLLFDWNVNAGYRNIPLADYYPGNTYVDMIGIDLYDVSPNGPLPPIGSPTRWPALASEPLGLDTVEAFAVAHHKPMSIPEWGTVGTTAAGDDPAYVSGMARFVATHDVAFQSWFDAGHDGVLPLLASQAPLGLRAYVANFGAKGYDVRHIMPTISGTPQSRSAKLPR